MTDANPTADADVVRVYDVTDDGYARVERLTRERNATCASQRVRVGRVDLAALAAFDGDVPSIDLLECDDRTAAFGRELVA